MLPPRQVCKTALPSLIFALPALGTVIPAPVAAALQRRTPQAPQLPFLADTSFGSKEALSSDVFDTSSLTFTALRGHLSSWASTFAPNGFGVVPATIPTGTIMYHSRRAGPPPTEGFDWFAFDAEHAYVFGGGGSGEAVMWHFSAARHFDGASAAKSPGPVDVQEVIAFGKARTTDGFNDWERFEALCKWAKEFDLDGFVREEGTFEYIHCDFTSPALDLVRGVDINVAIANTTGDSPRGPGRPPNGIAEISQEEGRSTMDDSPPKRPPGGGPPGGGGGGGGPGWRGPSSVYESYDRFLFIRATAWHHIRPDPRVHTHPEYFVSLYDTSSYPSLAPTVILPRGSHSLANLSKTDTSAFLAELSTVLHAWNSNGETSGVDWSGMVAAASDRYGDTLNELAHLLSSRQSVQNSTIVVDKVRLLTFAMLEPYVSGPGALSVWPAPPSPHDRRKSLAATAEICTDGFTSHLNTKRMTRQELRIKKATEGVLKRICGTAAARGGAEVC
ncbi:hypothetical protein RQP46_006557 [Phenoliferia psychrophenolica]